MPIAALETLVGRLKGALDDRPEVLEAYLFGSRARGDDATHSDVDVAVYLEHEIVPQPPFGHAAQLAAYLMAALNESRVDVVVLNDASPLLYHRVLRDGVRILSRSLRETTTREGAALSRYCDYVPQLRMIDAAHGLRLARGDFGR
jgi:predicted nucleotidyltransferase